jgi:methionine-rich copper-binding protein CopC
MKILKRGKISAAFIIAFTLSVFFFRPLLAHATLIVTLNEPKATGGKAVIKLTMTNTFTESIESARAVVFLFDDQGKMVGQGTRWVIGGAKNRPALEPEKETVFNFVVDTDKPFTKTKVSFNRLVLQGGKLADVTKDVQVQIRK